MGEEKKPEDKPTEGAPAEGASSTEGKNGGKPIEHNSTIPDTVSATDSVKFHLKVYSPFKTYYDDDVVSISAVNDTGPFDILGKHKNFMTLINPCDLVIRNGKVEEKVPINRGIMHVKSDKVIVFLDI